MPSPSSVKTLPADIQAHVNRLLIDDGWTLDQLVAYLADAGHPRSRSALGRYKKHLDGIALQIKASREIAKTLGREIGPDATEGRMGRVLIEILQKLSFDRLMEEAEQDEPTAPLDLMRLARTINQIMSAQKIDADRELKIRKEARERAVSESAETGERVLTEAGVSAETIDTFRRSVLGISQA